MNDMKNKRVLVVGELNVDLILHDIKGFPNIGEEKVANKMATVLGSSSAIFAANISILGVDTYFCGMVGDDYFGDFIKNNLVAKNVDCSYIKKLKNIRTGVTIVMNYDQDRANVTYCGAMEELSLKYIPWSVLNEFDHLHFSNLFLQKNIQNDIAELFQRAKETGLTTSLDLQTDPEGVFAFDYASCLPFVDVFLPNKSELLGITQVDSVEEALKKISPFANLVALKMGEQGSVLVYDGKEIVETGYSHSCFVDAIGAGDSFNAGFISKYLVGESFVDCLKFGNLTGAINTTAAGGTGAFRTKAQIRKIAKEIFNQDI